MRREKHLYADVALRQGSRVSGVFTYAVPAALVDQVAIGQVVWVPFRRRRLPAIVVGMSELPPGFTTREVEAIIDPVPVLTASQLALGRWLAGYYLCSLAEALLAMLPPGLLHRSHTEVALTAAGRTRSLEGLSPTSRRIIEKLRETADPLTARAVAQAVPGGHGEELLDRLSKRGWLELRHHTTAPRAQPHYETFLVLTVPPAAVAALRQRLWAGTRESRQARVLELLAAARGGTLAGEELREQSRTRAADWQALAAAGLVEVGHEVKVTLRCLPEVAQAEAATLRRTKTGARQVAMLDALVREEGRALSLPTLYRQVQGAERGDVDELVAAGVGRCEEREVYRDPCADWNGPEEAPPELTMAQGQVWRELYEHWASSAAFLLHGVTGSGKTEIYLRAVARALREGRQALVLVPEIGLTPQAVRRFRARFPGRVAVLHSGLTIGERYDQWRRIRSGQADVVIGPRSALFAPLPRLGLIVLDEEHDSAYKQENPAPRYHAREAALTLGRITGSVVLLGSATPALETYLRAQRGELRLLELPGRIRVQEEGAMGRHVLVDDTLPTTLVVDMREELSAGNTSMFSRALQRDVTAALARGEQAILFLNRRGTATLVLCRECGHVLRCKSCGVSYVYHAETDHLLCHRCGRGLTLPKRCPECGGSKIRQFGVGTERVAETVQELFPTARVLRWDSDTAHRPAEHAAILEALVQHEADILVGTQMVAKGLDLPLVTVVGVVSADTSLLLPDFRAAERTFQMLTQVVGRAGRRAERGRAIIQTYHPTHYAIQAAAKQDYAAFYRQELAFRQRLGYPPCGQLVQLIYSHHQEDECCAEAERLARLLAERLPTQGRLIGPAPAFVARWHGQFRWQVAPIVARDVQQLLAGLVLPAGWAVDVDPASVLA